MEDVNATPMVNGVEKADANGDAPMKMNGDVSKVACNEMTSKDYYFDSYAHFAIHEEMLKDEVRTLTYRDSMVKNKHLFKDKIVLDVGCGTGILSMFAVKAGAKHVYSVDMSNIIDEAKGIVEDNGMADKITLIKGKIEEIKLPVDTVHIIISEWMGYALIYESMLESVLFARDKWLCKKTGIMMPDKATMYVCSIEDAKYKEDKIHFWDSVYGFDMKRIKKIAITEPLVDSVDGRQVNSTHCKIHEIDLMTVTPEDAGKLDCTFSIRANRDDYIHAMVLYWTCEFSKCHTPIGFTTGPGAQYTHWKQTVFYLDEDVTAKKGEELCGTIKCTQNKSNKRDLDFEINYEFYGELSSVSLTQKYRMR